MIPRHPHHIFEVVIIGGGINGAGIARELAIRGIKVGLFEKNDFGSGTSSASSKLAHGGLRYLETGDFSLVFEACHERERLLKNAPHLAKSLPFIIPIYKHSRRPKWQIRIGLWLYDLLSTFQTVKTHKMLSKKEVLELEPDINPTNLVGGALYYDAQIDDARIVLENILDAEYHGAEVHNYTEVTRFDWENGKIKALYVKQKNSETEYKIIADLFINTTGPWSDITIEKINPTSPKNLRLSKGVHIMLPKLTENALLLTAKRDNRVFFVLPWNNHSMVGTTETDYTDSPDDVAVNEEDIAYLLEEIQPIFPNTSLTRDSVIASFAGLRPLVQRTGKTASDTSREHRLIEDGNIIHVLGGKYTTFRKISEDVAKVVHRILKKGPLTSITKQKPLWGGRIADIETHIEQHAELECTIHNLEPKLYAHLVRQYGNKYLYVISILNENPYFKHYLEGTPYCVGEVIYAIRYQKAKTPEDFLRRRTSIHLNYGINALCKKQVIELFKQFKR